MTGGFLVAAVTAFVVAQLKAIAYANRLSPSPAAAFVSPGVFAGNSSRPMLMLVEAFMANPEQ
ncbi:hypothetical protein P4910_18315 [Pantoea stewartii]|uniref:hypothetical protein n=1 Tax=Pantoea stewartii TaxID=66269 RepID=UPI0023F82E72|nr:hypothetical protein [Pantoea stewartii]MDF7787416.1 hypothetical protein [Pantoea stewartii]MEB6535513.1 hypothetical protein [Pantoea stewartii]